MAIVAVKLKVSFLSTVTAVVVFGSRIWCFPWRSGGRCGRNRVGRSGRQIIATITIEFCLENGNVTFLSFFIFFQGGDEFGFVFDGFGVGIVVFHRQHRKAGGAQKFGVWDSGIFFSIRSFVKCGRRLSHDFITDMRSEAGDKQVEMLS